MKNIAKFIICVFLFICSIRAFGLENSVAGIERFALFIGSNTGGKNNEPLLYASTDAIEFQKTMTEIGGVSSSNGILLLNPTKYDVDKALGAISAAIERNKTQSGRTEFIFYYSGHSDENALLLGKNVYGYSALKDAISAVPSDVHVVILDSCYSGNFIRTKGGKKNKPFLIDDSSVVTGHAYLSSSSSKEFSQESEEIGSSFFTNSMITGLRGAADSSGDKRVTLNELYSYAFNETLSKTETSAIGPQHPNYNITLVGSGDLILSDISESEAMLQIAKEVEGTVIIRNNSGRLISEIHKTAENPIYIALEPGRYQATIIEDEKTLHGSFELKNRGVLLLNSEGMTEIKRSANKTRGASADSDENTNIKPQFHWEIAADMDKTNDRSIVSYASLGLLGTADYKIDGVQISAIYNFANKIDGGQISGVFGIANKIHGAQISGLMAKAGNIDGVQVSGAFGVANDITIAQISGAIGKIDYAKLFQISGAISIASQIDCFQAAGYFNTAMKVKSCQVAGYFNIANEIYGPQITGFVNVANRITGPQIAGFANVANNISGAQISLLSNAANKITGTQISPFFNFSQKTEGTQCGLINFSKESSGLSFGIINIILNGIVEFGTSYTSCGNMNISFRSGTKKLFTVLEYSSKPNYLCGTNSHEEDWFNYFTMGLGTRFLAKKFNFDIEALFTETLTKDKDYNKTAKFPSFRFITGFSPFKHFNIFSGVKLALEIDSWNSNAFDVQYRPLEMVFSEWSLHPEFEIGMKFKL